jgi:hypothetical protein
MVNLVGYKTSWDECDRKHAMIHGFLKAPKNVGTEFYIQPSKLL